MKLIEITVEENANKFSTIPVEEWEKINVNLFEVNKNFTENELSKLNKKYKDKDLKLGTNQETVGYGTDWEIKQTIVGRIQNLFISLFGNKKMIVATMRLHPITERI